MTYSPNSLVRSFNESATLTIGARAKKLAAEGKSIINFGLGEPDFKTPESISKAGYEAAIGGATKYTAVPGTPDLRSAIAKRLSADYEIPFSADEVCAANGGKQSIFHLFQVLLEPGDEVLIPAPYWTSFPEMVKMVGAIPKIITPKGPRLLASEIANAITSKTKLFVLNSPSNPSGLYFLENELKAFADVLHEKKIWVMSDDTYYALVYPPHRWTSILKVKPELRDRTCVIGSSSKSYAMTGWRLGWAVGPKPLIEAIVKVQGQVTSGPSSVSQAATVAALTTEHHWAAEFRDRYAKRRLVALEALRAVSGLSVAEPEGAFYAFVDLGKRIPGAQVTKFCGELLEKHGVCLIPGEAFGCPSFARLSYCLSEEQIKEGVKRLAKALAEWRA